MANAAEAPREAPRLREREPEQKLSEPEAAVPRGSGQEEADGRTESGVDLASEWVGIMGELKRRRQALTAAVYGEARVEGFDGQVLRLVYPEDQSFHVGMARESAHLEKLGSRSRRAPRFETAPGGQGRRRRIGRSGHRRTTPPRPSHILISKNPRPRREPRMDRPRQTPRTMAPDRRRQRKTV